MLLRYFKQGQYTCLIVAELFKPQKIYMYYARTWTDERTAYKL